MRSAETLILVLTVLLTICACDKPAATPPEAGHAVNQPQVAQLDPVPVVAAPPLLVDSRRAGAALAELASCLEEAKEGVESAVAANAAIVKGDGDLKPIYATLCAKLDALGAQRKAVSNATQSVREELSDLIARWKDAIEALEDADRKRVGQERLASTEACYAAIRKDGGDAPRRIDALLAILSDHRLFLEFDFNADAARSLAHDEKKVTERSSLATSVLDRMLEATRSCIASLTLESA